MKLDALVALYPTKVEERAHRVFGEHPFGRSCVSFRYAFKKRPVRIYEEFTFNTDGEIVFIEAWSDSYELKSDAWGESNERVRMSHAWPKDTHGNLAPPGSESYKKALKTDPLLQELHARMQRPIYSWMRECLRFVTSR